MSRPEQDTPGVLIFPPLLFLATLASGVALHLVRPIRPLPALWARLAGGLLILGAGLLARAAKGAMHRAGTNIRPDRPATALVQEGPFRVTRNPLYLSLLAILAGLSLLANMAAPLLLLPVMFALLHFGVVLREERYLEAKFGEPYRAYRARVRRWI